MSWINSLKVIGGIEAILIITSFLIGIKFPDWDFKMKIRHRNILTHSPLILWVMIYFYQNNNNVEIFRYSIMGFSLAIGLHLIFDFFPKGWARGALIHLPFCNYCIGVKQSKALIFISSIYSLYLSVKYSSVYTEVFVLGVLSFWTIYRNIRKEEKFFRPFFMFSVFFIILSCVKYGEIRELIYFSATYLNEKLKLLL